MAKRKKIKSRQSLKAENGGKADYMWVWPVLVMLAAFVGMFYFADELTGGYEGLVKPRGSP